jgi:hypothetical protein
MAAFMPGASPPEVRTPTLCMFESMFEFLVFETLLDVYSVSFENYEAQRYIFFNDATKKTA